MKNKIIVSSILTIALCLSMIAGSTFALFTSESKVDIAVTSGKVAVTATVDGLTTSSLGVAQTAGTFANGGTAVFNNGTLTLTNVTPGDVASFKIIVTNDSNVSVKYRITWSVAGELAPFLTATVNGNALTNNSTAWALWEGEDTQEFAVVVELPQGTGNGAQNKTADISFKVEAVQGNVDILDNIIYSTDENGNKVIGDAMGELPEKVSILEGTVALRNKWLQGNTTVKEVVVPVGLTDFGGTPNAEGTGASGGFFNGSAVEKVTLPEGLTEIPVAAFNGANNLKEVNIPTTVTKVGINSFAYAGLETLTVPATITEIGYGAFRGMANLETVVIETGANIPLYAFRECASLRTVIITNSNVTFGDGTRGMIFTNKQNGDGSAITIYVPTQEVADRLLAADTAAKDYGGYKIVVGDPRVNNTAELVAAINARKTEIFLRPGNYDLRFTNNTNFNVDGITIKGLGNNVNLAISSSEGWYGRVQGSNVTFENIHFTSTVGTTGKATYNNCTFDSWTICASSNKAETYYNNCTINGCLNTSTDFSSGDVYVNNCYIAKAEYSGSMTMNFKDCTIGEMIIWNSNTNLTNCKVTTLDTSNVTDATVTVK